MSKQGGKRTSAGRPIGSGRYGMPTRSMRVPIALTPEDLERVIWRSIDELPEGSATLLVKYASGKTKVVNLLGGLLLCEKKPDMWCYIPTNSGKGV